MDQTEKEQAAGQAATPSWTLTTVSQQQSVDPTAGEKEFRQVEEGLFHELDPLFIQYFAEGFDLLPRREQIEKLSLFQVFEAEIKADEETKKKLADVISKTCKVKEVVSTKEGKWKILFADKSSVILWNDFTLIERLVTASFEAAEAWAALRAEE